uniref:Uncharacterized protein n=1 Tax=Oryza brachyantha TaxID=4533 RepID=J3M4R0_ORYBR
MEDDAGAARKRKRRGEAKPKGKPRPKGKAKKAAVAGEAAAGKEEDYVEGITEESIAEVMSWLELEIKLASSSTGATAASPAAFPPMASLAAAGGGYVQAAKGSTNMEGSCGASFSGSASTVMASVDLRAGTPAPPPLPWPLPGGATAADESDDDDDDAWVDQLLTDGPAVQE